jgi:hypothetical protein
MPDWRDLLDQDLSLDPRIGHYDLLGVMGEGAAGVVYRARHRELGQLVAVKVLRSTSEVARERFRREGRTTAGLRHPNVVAVHDAGEDHGKLFLVMELVEGTSMREQRGPERLRLLEQAARGVGAAHAQGVVHRDLKPANILVGPAGQAKVADFGLAHLVDSSLTATGGALGTPLYMAPEQVRGGEITPRTDVYALGAMLHEILAGRPPHEAATPHELYARIVRDEPSRLDGPLGTIAAKALEKDPGRRYADAASFADDLARALDGRPIEARRRLRLPRWWRGAAVAAALAVVAFAVMRERTQRIGLLREQAEVALDAVLKLRRAGDVEGMAAFVAPFEAAYRRAPESAETEYLMGRLRRALMDVGPAEAHQDRALALDPGYAPARYERAILRAARYGAGLRERPDDPALEALREEILRDCAALPRKRVVEGLLALHRRDWAGARAILEEVVRAEPLLEEAWHALGTTAARLAAQVDATADRREEALQALDAAEEVWTRAIAHDRGYGPHWLGRGLLHRSRGLLHMRRGGDAEAAFRKAEADLTRALELKADGPETLGRRSNVRDLTGIDRMGRGQDPTSAYDAAERDVEEGLSRYGPRGEFLIARAAIALHRAMWKARRRDDPFPELAKAEADLLQAAAQEVWADAARNALGALKLTRADYRKRRGEDPRPDWAAAELDFSEALRRNPGLTPAWVGRGSARQELGGLEDLRRAEADYAEATRLTPANGEAWLRRGRVRLRRSKLEGADGAALRALARTDLERGFALSPAQAREYAGDLADANK